MKIKELFYLANIIDYARVVALYWALTSDNGYSFVGWYSFSYILDAFDGYAARALNQESRLGYYLDMVIDRVSSCLCLHFAAKAVLSGSTCIPTLAVWPVAILLRICIILVEILAHGTVMFLSEVVGVHQKQMGYDWRLVRMYLSDKRYLTWACVSFESFSLGLVLNWPVLILLSLPGFLFRAAANVARLASICGKWPENQCQDGEVPRRGSSDRLGNHRAASPPGAQIRRGRSGSTASDK